VPAARAAATMQQEGSVLYQQNEQRDRHPGEWGLERRILPHSLAIYWMQGSQTSVVALYCWAICCVNADVGLH